MIYIIRGDRSLYCWFWRLMDRLWEEEPCPVYIVYESGPGSLQWQGCGWESIYGRCRAIAVGGYIDWCRGWLWMHQNINIRFLNLGKSWSPGASLSINMDSMDVEHINSSCVRRLGIYHLVKNWEFCCLYRLWGGELLCWRIIIPAHFCQLWYFCCLVVSRFFLVTPGKGDRIPV